MADVLSLELEFMGAADAMIEEIVLPLEVRGADVPGLPASNDKAHIAIEGKRQQRMQVVWHQQKEVAAPSPSLVIENGRIEQRAGEARVNQGYRGIPFEPDANVEDRVVFHPRWGVMMQAAGGVGGHGVARVDPARLSPVWKPATT